jgi:CRP-like cAMP-binding protein
LLSAQDYNVCVQQLEGRIRNSTGAETIRTSRTQTNEIELSDTDWDLIFSAEKSANLRFSKDDVIIEQGLRYDMVCQISSGSVRVEKRGTEGLITLAVLQVGAVFGEITFLTGGVASASVIADDNVELFIIHKSSLQTLITNHRETVVKFYHHLCETLAHRISEHEKYFYSNCISYVGETSLGISMPVKK